MQNQRSSTPALTDEDQPFLPHYLDPLVQCEPEPITHELSRNQRIALEASPEVIFQYMKLPLNMRPPNFSTIGMAIRKGFVKATPMRKFTVVVDTGTPARNFVVEPRDEHWYPRICSEIANCVGVPYVELLAEDGHTLEKHGVQNLYSGSVGTISMKAESGRARRATVPQMSISCELTTADRDKIAGKYSVRSSSSDSFSSSENFGDDDQNSDIQYREEAEEFAKSLSYTIGEKMAECITSKGEDWKKNALAYTTASSVTPIVSSSVYEQPSVDAFFERSGMYYPGEFVQQVAHRVAETVKDTRTNLSISENKSVSDQIHDHIGTLLEQCGISGSLCDYRNKLSCWMKKKLPYSFRGNKRHHRILTDSSSSDSEKQPQVVRYRKHRKGKTCRLGKNRRSRGRMQRSSSSSSSSSSSDSSSSDDYKKKALTAEQYLLLAKTMHSFGETPSVKSVSSEEPLEQDAAEDMGFVVYPEGFSPGNSANNVLPWDHILNSITGEVGEGKRAFVIEPNVLNKGTPGFTKAMNSNPAELYSLLRDHVIVANEGWAPEIGGQMQSLGGSKYNFVAGEDNSLTVNGHCCEETEPHDLLTNAYVIPVYVSGSCENVSTPVQL